MYMLRAIGGTLYIIGAVLMAFNLYKTAKSGQFVPDTGSPGRAAHARRRRREDTPVRAIAGWKPSR